LIRQKIEMDFQGLAYMAEYPGIADILRSTFDCAVATTMVLPHVIAVPLGTEDQGVDRSLLNQPKPKGVLRAFACKATGLPAADWHMFSQPTSDPYLLLTIGDEKWRSATVNATCNPVWKGDNTSHDFMVFAQEQRLQIDVYDQDKLSSDDFIARAKPLTVFEALAKSEVPIQLYDPKVELDAPKVTRCGRLVMRFEWLELRPQQMGQEGNILTVKVDEVFLPSKYGKSVRVIAKIANAQQATPVKNMKQAQVAEAACYTALEGVVKRARRSKLDEKTIAAITGLPQDYLPTFDFPNKQGATGRIPECAIFEVEIKHVLYLPVSKASLESGDLELSLVSRNGECFAKASVELRNVLSSPGFDYPPFNAMLTFKTEQSEKIQAQILISIWGLQSASLPPPVASKAMRSSHVSMRSSHV